MAILSFSMAALLASWLIKDDNKYFICLNLRLTKKHTIKKQGLNQDSKAPTFNEQKWGSGPLLEILVGAI